MELLKRLDTEALQIIIGIFAVIVVMYRIVFMMIPMFVTGVKTIDYATIFKSITLIV